MGFGAVVGSEVEKVRICLCQCVVNRRACCKCNSMSEFVYSVDDGCCCCNTRKGLRYSSMGDRATTSLHWCRNYLSVAR